MNISECYEYGLEVFSTGQGWAVNFIMNMSGNFSLLCISLYTFRSELSGVSMYTGLTHSSGFVAAGVETDMVIRVSCEMSQVFY